MDPLDDIPSAITAGDSYALRLTEPIYPASAGWSLRLTFVGAETLTKSSSASGDAHTLTLTPADTALLGAGQYRFTVKAVNGTDVKTVRGGITLVAPDLETATPGELTSWAERALVAVEAAILGAASDEMRMMMIDGRQLQKFSFDELLRLRVRLRAEVAAERGEFGVPIVMTATGFTS